MPSQRKELIKIKKIEKHLAPTYFTTEVVQASSTGTIASGWNKVSIYVSGGSAGTITLRGETLDASSGETHVFGSEAAHKAFDEITYDATGTEFKIIISRI